MSRRAVAWRVVLCGLVAGLIINIIEWGAHHWVLDADWRSAFHALGKEPKGWSTFIPANFWLGVLAVFGYRWCAAHYGPGIRSALRTSVVVWLVFWVIPMLALQPMELFPNRLLALTVIVGLIDAPAGTIVGAWLFDRISGPVA
jgi:hypothetical protein